MVARRSFSDQIHGWLNFGRRIPAIAGVFKGWNWYRQVPLVEMNPWICSLVDFEHVEKSNHLEKKGLTWSTRWLWPGWPDFDLLILRVLEGFWSRGLYRWIRLVELFALVYCLTHFEIVDFWSTQWFSSFDLGWLDCNRLSSCCKCLADFSRV